jgi:hypothetical protein
VLELTSAGYFAQSDEGIGREIVATPVRPPAAGIESVMRWLAAFVMIMLV